MEKNVILLTSSLVLCNPETKNTMLIIFPDQNEEKNYI